MTQKDKRERYWPAGECPACGSRRPASQWYNFGALPAHAGALYDSRRQAINAPRGNIVLGVCGTCTYVGNTVFDESLIDYGSPYNLSLFGSVRYRKFAEKLAAELRDRFSLTGGLAVDIGAGGGEFLQILCGSDVRGIGIEPGLRPQPCTPNISIVREYFGTVPEEAEGSFYSCRHVLEHVARPAEFVGILRRRIGPRAGVPVYFEVPNMDWILRDEAYWNINYEHASYFTPHALSVMFSRRGFVVEEVREVFGGQYLGVIARSRESDPGTIPTASVNLGQIKAFGTAYQRAAAYWRSTSKELQLESTIGWCAGARAVAFFNTAGLSSSVPIIDSNPARVGTFLPGTGQEIVGVDSLGSRTITTVLLTNPTFLREIQAEAAEYGQHPEWIQVGRAPGSL